MSEEVLGVVENAVTWNYKYNLFFTSIRVIVAKIRGPHDDLAWLLSPVAGVVADKLLKPEERRKDRLRGMSAEAILKADKSNFAIPYSEITRVEMKKFGTRRIMRILTDTKEHKFVVNRDRFDEYVNIVRSILPDKISVLS